MRMLHVYSRMYKQSLYVNIVYYIHVLVYVPCNPFCAGDPTVLTVGSGGSKIQKSTYKLFTPV